MAELPSESIREARAHFADVVDRADRQHTPTVITRRGKEVAVVMSYERFRELEALEDEADIRLVRERMAQRTGESYSLEEVMAEVLSRRE